MTRFRAWPGLLVLLALALAGCSDDDSPVPTHPEGVFGTPFLLSGRPFGAAFGPDGIILATRLDAATVGRGVISADSISDSIAVGDVPTDIVMSADGGSAFVTNQFHQNLGIISLGSNTQVATVPILAFTFRVLRGAGSLVYVSTNAAKVYAVNTATRAVVDSVEVGGDPNGMVLSPDGSRLYVSNRSTGDLSEVDISTMAVVRTIALGGFPQDVAVDKDGSELYVANESGPMQVINVASGAVTPAGAETSFLFGLALSPDGALLIGTRPSDGNVLFINRASRGVEQTLPATGQPRRVAFSPLGDFAIVANESGWIDRIH